MVFFRLFSLCAIVLLLSCLTDPGDDDTDDPDLLPPAAPDSIWVDSVTNTGFKAVWNSVDSADGYYLVLHDTFSTALDTITTADTSYSFSGLITHEIYMVSVASYKGTLTSETYTGYGTAVMYRFRNPPNVRLAGISRGSATITFDPTEDNMKPAAFWYRAYLCDYNGTILDSQDVDSSARPVTVTGLDANTAYKISLVTACSLGVNAVDSNCWYDTTASQYNIKQFPFIYVSTYTTPTAVNDTSMVPIKGGIYVMGYFWEKDSASILINGPVHEVIVLSFHISKYEVTAEEYMAFLNATTSALSTSDPWLLFNGDTLGDTSKVYWPLTCDGPTFSVKTGKERYPMLGLFWHGAAAYCNWLSAQKGLDSCYNAQWECDFTKNGCRLPTEAEFEYLSSRAVTGYKTRFTWGFEWKTNEAVVFTSGPSQVGSCASFYGIYDLAGNAMEYVNDWSDMQTEFSDTSIYYGQCAAEGVVVDPRGPASQVQNYHHLMRGGSYELGMKGNLSA